jgi:hypothetical protein
MYMAFMTNTLTCDLKLLYAVSSFNPFIRQLFVAETQVRSQTSSFGVCDGKSKVVKDFFPRVLRFFRLYHSTNVQHSINHPFIHSFVHSFIHLSTHSFIHHYAYDYMHFANPKPENCTLLDY